MVFEPCLCLRSPVGGGGVCAKHAPLVLPPYPQPWPVHLDSCWCHDDLHGEGRVSNFCGVSSTVVV